MHKQDNRSSARNESFKSFSFLGDPDPLGFTNPLLTAHILLTEGQKQ